MWSRVDDLVLTGGAALVSGAGATHDVLDSRRLRCPIKERSPGLRERGWIKWFVGHSEEDICDCELSHQHILK